MDDGRRDNFARALLFSPAIFVAHFMEESPRFVEWFNAHVERGITSGLFWRVNITALIITLVVVAIEWFSRSALSLSLTVVWLSFLMLANALFHIAGGLVDGRYVPGLATAVLLYLPFYSWLFLKGVQAKRVSVQAMVACTVLGATPMLIHGYLILFRGSRLF